MDETATADAATGGTAAAGSAADPVVAGEGVRKEYGDVVALEGLDLDVPAGSLFGLLGPNGAGKTTILRMLTGYHFPTSGTATVNGYDVYTHPLTVKRSIGYLPESAPLYTELNVMEYLQFIAEARAIPPAERDDHIDIWRILHARRDIPAWMNEPDDG